MGEVVEYPFHVGPAGSEAPGVAWLPAGIERGSLAPVVVFGHGLTHDKRSPLHVPLARELAAERGIVSIALDAPAHGERAGASGLSPDERWLAYREQWRRAEGRDRAQAIDQAIAHVCAAHSLRPGPIGYWGLSLGTQYGLAFLAGSASVAAAVLGLFAIGPRVARYARRVRCPVFFLRQLDDEVHAAASVEELYEELARPGSRLVTSPGAHVDVPEGVVREALTFMITHLEASG